MRRRTRFRLSSFAASTVAATMTVLAIGESSAPLAAQASDRPDGLTGTVVVVNKQGNDASFIDLATGRIVATAPTGNGPHELGVSADGRTAVVTDYGRGSNSLTVLDVASGTRTGTIDLGEFTSPHGIAWMPDGERVAVTSESTGNVVIVSIPERRVVGSISTDAQNSHMLAVTADGGTIWTGDMGSNTVSELDVASMRKVRAFPAPETPEAVNVTPDGSRVFAGSNDTGVVTAFDTSDGSTSVVGEGFGWPYRIYPTPGVRQILIPDLRAEVLRFFDGSDYTELGSIAFPGEGPQGLILHPDGRHLFLSLSRAGRIAVVDIETRSVVGYLPAGAGPDGIGYSPLVVGGRP
jgi:DNA-binding beta-propeller fold protein YncE